MIDLYLGGAFHNRHEVEQFNEIWIFSKLVGTEFRSFD